jgi:cytochrome c biogenesis protein CcdA
MVGTIGPMVYGKTFAGRSLRVAVYAGASVFGAAVVGASIGLIGKSVRAVEASRMQNLSLACFSLCCFFLSLHELRLISLPLPQFPRQVPKTWRRLSTLGICLYGSILGAGIGTRIPTSSYYALIVGIFLMGRIWYGTVAMIVFGLARAMPICIFAAMEIQQAEESLTSLFKIQELVHIVNGALLLWVGILLSSGWLILA